MDRQIALRNIRHWTDRRARGVLPLTGSALENGKAGLDPKQRRALHGPTDGPHPIGSIWRSRLQRQTIGNAQKVAHVPFFGREIRKGVFVQRLEE